MEGGKNARACHGDKSAPHPKCVVLFRPPRFGGKVPTMLISPVRFRPARRFGRTTG